MVVWLKRQFGFNSYDETFDHFDKVWKALGSPKEMLLVKNVGESDLTLFMRLPHERLDRLFEGFERCSLADLPKNVGILIAHADEFDELRRLLTS